MQIDIAILGGGIAGLGAALRARELNRSAVIFEARPSAGGLLDCFERDGFRFDHAVHLSFTKDARVRAIFDQTPCITHSAEALCYENGRWLKHPVQNNLFPLEPEQKVKLIQSFLERPDFNNIESYADWLINQYGHEIAQRYPMRYTRKYWGVDAKSLSTNWIGSRMRRAEISEILYGSFSQQTPNDYYTGVMRYPRNGGYKAFIAPLISASRIFLNHRVVRIDSARRILHFSNGTQAFYNQLVSTLPLPEMPALLGDAPRSAHEAASQLKATAIDLISIAFDRVVTDKLWFYIYDEDILAARAHSPSVKTPNNAPTRCSSLQFEIYSLNELPPRDPDVLIANTRASLRRLGIPSEASVLFIDHRRVKYGNVVFLRGMEDQREIVLDLLRERSILSCGRFGAWDYFWSDESLLSGYHSLSS